MAALPGTHTQDEPEGIQTQSGVDGQHSVSTFATFFIVADFVLVAELQLLELHDDWLHVALAFFGASVAKLLTDASRNRADRAAEMKFFMVLKMVDLTK